MSSTRDLLVFDIDDTLTRSESQHIAAYVNTMIGFGMIDIDRNWKDYKHHTDSYILKQNYERNFNHAFELSFVDRFENRVSEHMLSFDPVDEVKGAASFVQYINTATNHAVCFATGSLIKPAMIKLRQAGIPFNERLLVGSNTIYDRETIVQTAIDKAKEVYGVDDFEHVISFGDGLWDLQTAHNLGIHFVGIGEKNREDLRNAQVKLHIKDWKGFDLDAAKSVLGIRTSQ